MNYLRKELDHYSDRRGLQRVVLVSLSIVEDLFRWLHLPYQTLRPIWFLRGRLTEGKTRRLLRRVVRYWKKNGIYEQNYFDCGERALVITLEWKDIRVMKGYNNQRPSSKPSLPLLTVGSHGSGASSESTGVRSGLILMKMRNVVIKVSDVRAVGKSGRGEFQFDDVH